MLQLSLANARWEFRDAARRARWYSASVPGCVHRDLLRHELIPDPFYGRNEATVQWIEEHDWEYRATFDVPPELLGEDALDLVADGLDTVATVRLNGRELGRSDNMFVGHRWSAKDLMRPRRNELTIRFDSAMRHIRTHRTAHRPREINDPVGGCTRIRKQQCQFGWDWGPRLVTAGIWRDLRLEAWSGNRLESVRVTQDHRRDGTVRLVLAPELARPERDTGCRWVLSFGRVKVAEGSGTTIRIPHPQLWWPAGHGAQPLYDLHVQVQRSDGSAIGEWSRRLGLRTIELVRRRDRWGESFHFAVNGRPMFAKGANWIPAHSFVAGLGREDYARDLRSAVAANMNMIRVWGGGIYESEDFYDLCDELGLLVWQDFMFACTMYPGDRAFIASATQEAEQQIRRLRHRACLALWCGNNEIEYINRTQLEQPKPRRDYVRLFDEALPRAVARWDGTTAYWPSSPFRGGADHGNETGERQGDTHYWDVWHARHPVEDYTKWKFRFVSEFGMQSFSSTATQATFCPPEDANVFGPTMTDHQKNRLGNQIILDYVSQYYRFPRDQAALIYLSQLNQARCMQVGTEHWRRNMPRCMGALYWQLNDCWPVASWSSIEFTGRWKALHFVARRFFAPCIASALAEGTESVGISNLRSSNIHAVHLYTVSDRPEATRGELRWDVFHIDGTVVQRGNKAVTLRYGESVRQATVDLAAAIAKHGRDNLVVRYALEVDGERVSEDSLFLTAPRFIALPRARTQVDVRIESGGDVLLTFASDAFQHRFAFDVPGVMYTASDNFFELYPGEAKTVRVRLTQPLSATQLRQQLTHGSLIDSY